MIVVLFYHFQTVDPQFIPMDSQEPTAQNENPDQPPPPTLNEEGKLVVAKISANDSFAGEAQPHQVETALCAYPMPIPAFFPPVVPVPFWIWPSYAADTSAQQAHEIVKPTASHTKSPINVDELVGMSKLSLGSSSAGTAPPLLSLDLPGGSKRQSAFHYNPPTEDHHS